MTVKMLSEAISENHVILVQEGYQWTTHVINFPATKEYEQEIREAVLNRIGGYTVCEVWTWHGTIHLTAVKK